MKFNGLLILVLLMGCQTTMNENSSKINNNPITSPNLNNNTQSDIKIKRKPVVSPDLSNNIQINNITNSSIEIFHFASREFSSLMFNYTSHDKIILDCKFSGTKTFTKLYYKGEENGIQGEFGKAIVDFENCEYIENHKIIGQVTGTVAHHSNKSFTTLTGSITSKNEDSITQIDNINNHFVMEYKNKNTRTHNYSFEIKKINKDKSIQLYKLKTNPIIKSVQFSLDSGGLVISDENEKYYYWNILSEKLSNNFKPNNIIDADLVL
ncbi:MAG: hypothetical protein HRU38_05640 [Saccharospirillaceae bacterium]|nr:hypothetical protein [Pseudomonadales bacterium]NRB78139.1 hypothetical protein [Saccharospirillaceae bacterium]